MLLEKIKEHYKDNLPGKSAFRNDPEAPCTVEEISEEYGNWELFVVEYNKPAEVKPKAAPVKTTKQENTTNEPKK